jgi:hypothetical protein
MHRYIHNTYTHTLKAIIMIKDKKGKSYPVLNNLNTVP